MHKPVSRRNAAHVATPVALARPFDRVSQWFVATSVLRLLANRSFERSQLRVILLAQLRSCLFHAGHVSSMQPLGCITRGEKATAAIQDRIERIVILPVSLERAWAAITEPEQMSQWAGAQVEMELLPGAEARLVWGDDVVRWRIDAFEPPGRFAYRWYPGSGDDLTLPLENQPATMVEFFLEEIPEGTKLTLIESGFAALPPDHFERSLKENNEGWDALLGMLVAYFDIPAAG